MTAAEKEAYEAAATEWNGSHLGTRDRVPDRIPDAQFRTWDDAEAIERAITTHRAEAIYHDRKAQAMATALSEMRVKLHDKDEGDGLRPIRTRRVVDGFVMNDDGTFSPSFAVVKEPA